MKRKYWITKTGRIIPPLPAPIKTELEELGIVFEDGGKVDFMRKGKKVIMEFIQEREEKDHENR